MNLQFKNGKFSELKQKVDFDSYDESQSFGETAGVSFVLYENREDAQNWIVRFQTSTSTVPIFVDSWIDLIELLSKLSPIALAGIFDEGVTSMDSRNRACLRVKSVE